jgi:hypothetical protein
MRSARGSRSRGRRTIDTLPCEMTSVLQLGESSRTVAGVIPTGYSREAHLAWRKRRCRRRWSPRPSPPGHAD